MPANNHRRYGPQTPHPWHIIEEANNTASEGSARVGLALISRDFEVLHANDVHLRRWPDLIGATCYEHCNGFHEPCVWCPVQLTLSKGGIHQAIAASPSHDSDQLEYSYIVAIPVLDETGALLDVALEVVFNLTGHQRQMVEASNKLHSFLKSLCGFLPKSNPANLYALTADLVLFATVSTAGLGLDKATVLMATFDSQLHVQYAKTLEASAVNHGFESLARDVESPVEMEAVLDAVVVNHEQPDVLTLIGVTPRELDLLEHTDCPRRIGCRKLALSIRSTASPLSLILVAESLRPNDLIVDHVVNDSALLQALFSGALDSAQVAVPIGTALDRLARLLKALQSGGENIIFAAPVAYGLAHDLTPAMNAVTEQITLLEGEIGAREINRRSLRQILDNLKMAQSRFKVCRHRLQSLATLFKKTAKQRERCYLNSVVNEVSGWLGPEFTHDGIEFAFRRSDQLKDDALCADPIQLFQLVYNPIANAVKAVRRIPKSRRIIRVRTYQPDSPDSIGFSVEDSAGTLSPEVQKYMYEPFFTTDKYGTGLGLWIVNKIVSRLSARSVVKVRSGVSTLFEFDLPREW